MSSTNSERMSGEEFLNGVLFLCSFIKNINSITSVCVCMNQIVYRKVFL